MYKSIWELYLPAERFCIIKKVVLVVSFDLSGLNFPILDTSVNSH